MSFTVCILISFHVSRVWKPSIDHVPWLSDSRANISLWNGILGSSSPHLTYIGGSRIRESTSPSEVAALGFESPQLTLVARSWIQEPHLSREWRLSKPTSPTILWWVAPGSKPPNMPCYSKLESKSPHLTWKGCLLSRGPLSVAVTMEFWIQDVLIRNYLFLPVFRIWFLIWMVWRSPSIRWDSVVMYMFDLFQYDFIFFTWTIIWT